MCQKWWLPGKINNYAITANALSLRCTNKGVKWRQRMWEDIGKLRDRERDCEHECVDGISLPERKKRGDSQHGKDNGIRPKSYLKMSREFWTWWTFFHCLEREWCGKNRKYLVGRIWTLLWNIADCWSQKKRIGPWRRSCFGVNRTYLREFIWFLLENWSSSTIIRVLCYVSLTHDVKHNWLH